MADAGDRRLLFFLTLSIALHALWLALPLQHRTAVEATMLAPLDIQLVPPAPAQNPEQKSAVAVRHLPHPLPRDLPVPTTRNSPAMAATPTEVAPQPPVTINLDAAFATARSLAKTTPAAAPLSPPQMTMATAVAGALRHNDTVETRGASGEYVTITGKTRCVTPLQVPHYLEGKTMLTQCETRKG